MTYVLAAVVLVGAGFLAGTMLNKGIGPWTRWQAQASEAASRGGALPSGVPGAGRRMAAASPSGTVTKVDGDTVDLKQADERPSPSRRMN